MTLVELMISLTILTMIAATVATMALAVQTAGSFVRERGTTVQHARVVLDRIDRTLQSATVSEAFPGFLVVSWSEAGSTFPDTLVIWQPKERAANPNGAPITNELVIIRPNPNNPAELLEITNRDEPPTPITFSTTNTAEWQLLIQRLTERSHAEKVVLTDLLRVAAVSNTPGANQRGVVRFRQSVVPSDEQLANCPREESNGKRQLTNWQQLPWPQKLGSNNVGLRSLVCFTELQLVSSQQASSVDETLPFFGSAAIWQGVNR